jgi:hypothetical protein
MTSPNALARTAAVFYLLVFATGIFALSGNKLVVSDNAAATAANILAHETTFRLAWLATLLASVCYVVVTALFYRLFKPVSAIVSLTAALFSLAGCAVSAAGLAFYAAPLTILTMNAFPTAEAQALSLLCLRLSAQTSNTALVFFGVYCLLIGCLVYRSAFLPRILGILMMIAGIGWLTFLWPPLVKALAPYNMMPGILGEAALTLWLLAVGVRARSAR